MFPVLILAGGLATRLRPITEKIPKSLIDINDKPFIDYQLTYLKNQGVSDVILCLGYLHEMVEAYVGDGSRFGLKVKYSLDGEKLLGTLGAIKRAEALVPPHFFILYGDSYLPINFWEVQKSFEKSGKKALMTVLKNDDKWDKSNIIFQDGRLVEYNKFDKKPAMSYIDYGLSVFSKSLLTKVAPNEPADLADLFGSLSTSGDLAGFEVAERFYEVGSLKGIEEFKEYISQKI